MCFKYKSFPQSLFIIYLSLWVSVVHVCDICVCGICPCVCEFMCLSLHLEVTVECLSSSFIILHLTSWNQAGGQEAKVILLPLTSQHRGFNHGFLHGHEGFELMDLCLHIKLCCLLRHLPGPECKSAEEFLLSRWK